MATKPSALDKGIEYITQAVDHDVKARYADAYKAYMMGLDYMLLALKWEKNPKVNTMIRSKISEYLDRTETIKRFLDSTANQTSTHKPSDHNAGSKADIMDGTEGNLTSKHAASTVPKDGSGLDLSQMDGSDCLSETSESKPSTKGIAPNMANMDGKE